MNRKMIIIIVAFVVLIGLAILIYLKTSNSQQYSTSTFNSTTEGHGGALSAFGSLFGGLGGLFGGLGTLNESK